METVVVAAVAELKGSSDGSDPEDEECRTLLGVVGGAGGSGLGEGEDIIFRPLVSAAAEVGGDRFAE